MLNCRLASLLRELERGEDKSDIRYIEKKNLNGRYKFNYINNDIKCEWIKQSNKRQILQVEKKKQDPSLCCL